MHTGISHDLEQGSSPSRPFVNSIELLSCSTEELWTKGCKEGRTERRVSNEADVRGRYGIEIDGRDCFEKSTLVQNTGVE